MASSLTIDRIRISVTQLRQHGYFRFFHFDSSALDFMVHARQMQRAVYGEVCVMRLQRLALLSRLSRDTGAQRTISPISRGALFS